MTAKSKSIDAIFDEYAIPKRLRMHMYRVAGIGDIIIDHWKGPDVHRDKLMRVLLLHDIGNIVKIDTESNSNNFDGIDVETFKDIKQRYINRYGEDDHRISRAIAEEIGLPEDELDLMDAKVFVKNDETVKSDDYDRKIGAYADQRVAPQGIRSIMGRLKEAKERYKDQPGTSMNNPRTDMLIECAERLKQQVMRYCTLQPKDINDDSVQPYINKLIDYEININGKG